MVESALEKCRKHVVIGTAVEICTVDCVCVRVRVRVGACVMEDILQRGSKLWVGGPGTITDCFNYCS